MAAKTIYLVEGRTGIYEDRRSWIVGAFSTPELAQERVDRAQAEGLRLFEIRHKLDHESQNCYDLNYSPDMESDWPQYRVIETTFVE